MSSWIGIKFDPLGFGALILHRCDLQCVPIWIVFGWFLLGRLLGGYGRGRG
ncbi:MAG TPA: hypothetical protein VJV58_21635 [Bradyrhizobium sp.]|jgi:hypothetical protein|uniref:hypothetical protein n=1 Tax=Bradyrhizobium sp. TaxID=376 RepID=UPI002B4974B8|nr:hypothetical protein [Bradyrhizobium sp.]HKO73540.1 hypothetical protein [Bradyrhizobium sp.]